MPLALPPRPNLEWLRKAAKDRWGSTQIDAMSRLGPRGQALVQHMIARGVAAAPKEYARLGDISMLASNGCWRAART